MEHFMNEVVHILDMHVKHHFDILDVLNIELKTRPTYLQAMNHFRLNIDSNNNDANTNKSDIKNEVIKAVKEEFETKKKEQANDGPRIF
jgi:hypothetical protein